MNRYLDVACPTCAQQPGEQCKGDSGMELVLVHAARIEAWEFVRNVSSSNPTFGICI
jgi:hypothetical protein